MIQYVYSDRKWWWQAGNSPWHGPFDTWADVVDAAHAAQMTAAGKVPTTPTLTEALDFYANVENWKNLAKDAGHYASCALSDTGRRARLALKQKGA